MSDRISSWRMVSVALGAVGLLAIGCSRCQREEIDSQTWQSLGEDQGISLTWRPSDAQRDDAARLLSKLADGRFPERVTSQPGNAELFLLLAAKSDRAEVVGAALRAMHAAYGDAGGRKEGRPAPSEDYVKVVAARLGSPDAKILDGAIAASANVLHQKTPPADVVARLVRVAETHAVVGARIDALSALARIPGFREQPAIAGAFRRALDNESAALLSHALYQLYQDRASGLVQRDAFLARSRALLTHRDPGVRGRAARLCAVLAPGDPELVAATRKMLDDPHPYARSAAAWALADLGDVGAIGLLVAKATDFAGNGHQIAYQKLVGGKSGVPHGARNETVSDPVVQALELLTAKLPDPYRRVSKDVNEEARKRNAAAARAWLEKHGSELQAPSFLDGGTKTSEPGTDAGTDAGESVPQPKAK
jgi:hypothetical protein